MRQFLGAEPPRRLGDLPADPFRYPQQPPGGSAGQGGLQPIVAPIQVPVGPASLDSIQEILLRLPDNIQRVWRNNFLQVPREAFPFMASDPSISVAALAQTNVVTYTVPDQYVGFLTHIGFDAGSALGSIQWSLMINGAIAPGLNEQQFALNTYQNPLPFPMELIQSRNVSIRANNISASPVYCGAIIMGWLERMTAEKGYGGSARSGI